MPYTEGYHGTDETTARKLLKSGFKSEPRDELYLAAPFQSYLAHGHGLTNAERAGSDNYAILTTTFPEADVRANYLGPDSIRFYGDDIATVAITGLSVFTRRGELIEGNPVEVTNE